MNTQNKGDILAERIEEILNEYIIGSPRDEIKSALAEYRKPWTPPAASTLTPEQITAGWLEWHGGECPVFGGSKPTVMFKTGAILKDKKASEWRWVSWDNYDIIAYRPDPYESLKKAHSDGDVIQSRHGSNTEGLWQDCTPSWNPDYDYRVKEPEPVMVDLCAEDITIGSEFLAPDKKRRAYVMVCEKGVTFHDIKRTFADLRENAWKINRNDGKGFVPCEKPEGDK